MRRLVIALCSLLAVSCGKQVRPTVEHVPIVQAMVDITGDGKPELFEYLELRNYNVPKKDLACKEYHADYQIAIRDGATYEKIGEVRVEHTLKMNVTAHPVGELVAGLKVITPFIYIENNHNTNFVFSPQEGFRPAGLHSVELFGYSK